MPMFPPIPYPLAVAQEFAGAELGDERLSKRLEWLSAAIAKQPSASLPAIAGSEAGLEATYRFLNNGRVTPEGLLAPHVAQTCKRAEQAGTVLVAHDTTEFEFQGLSKRPGLGRLRTGGQGFFGHVALALAADGTRCPLGVLGMVSWVRPDTPRRRTRAQLQRTTDKESGRWLELVQVTQERLAGQAQAIHIMDREADAYALLAGMITRELRFIVRLAHDRNVQVAEAVAASPLTSKLSIVLEEAEELFTREVSLSSRRPWNREVKRRHLPRPARVVTLSFRAATVTFKKPRFADSETLASNGLPNTISLNVIRVVEANPPEGAEPVQWLLATTESIESEEAVAAIVDHYRARWTIEEYFKALKTGCAYESRQLENRASLLNVLALCIPIAYLLLHVRSLARHAPEIPASELFSECQLAVLRSLSRPIALSPSLSIREAMRAIATLGGHIANNGEPGWLVLWRGYSKLLLAEELLLIMRQRCDES